MKIHVVPAEGGRSAAGHVLDRLLDFEHEADDELWMLLDTEHYTQGTHLSSFVSVITEARRQGVHVAVSKPCFEFWLLLHHVEESQMAALSSAREVELALRSQLGRYNKTNLRSEDFPIASVVEACSRAGRLDASVAGGEIPSENTSRVYKLWKALPSQLPTELTSLGA